MPMTIHQRRTKINNFFNRCFRKNWDISHERIKRYFDDPLNQIIVEIVAVRKYDKLHGARIGYRECATLLCEAIDKSLDIPRIEEIRKAQEKEQLEFNAIFE